MPDAQIGQNSYPNLHAARPIILDIYLTIIKLPDGQASNTCAKHKKLDEAFILAGK